MFLSSAGVKRKLIHNHADKKGEKRSEAISYVD